MDAEKNSFELQAQVRQNAEEIKNAMNDLYNWEKEIKDKEKQLNNQTESGSQETKMTLPVRSHIQELASKMSALSQTLSESTEPLTNGLAKVESVISPATEKHDTPYDPLELKRKEANEIKDRGNKHVKLAEYEVAIEYYTKAINLYEDDPIYYTNRALCYLKLERYDECIEDCERAIEIDSLAVKAYYRRMMANESLGNNMTALEDCKTVLMIEPKNIEAKRSLERINERLHKNVKSTKDPNFSSLRTKMVDILPIDKPAYKRSSKPLRRIAISDIVGPKDSKNYENVTISDEDIDKLFNSNCGHFEEIKSSSSPSASLKESTIKTSNNVPKQKSIIPLKIEEKETVKAANATTKNTEDSNKIIETNACDKTERPLPPAPTSTAQFYSNWKELTAQQKYHYLKSINLTHLCKILGAGFDSDTLTDIIRTIHDFYLLQKDATTTLLEISKNKQMSILSLLMSNEERKALSEIINSLKENNSLDTVAAEQIMKNFNLN